MYKLNFIKQYIINYLYKFSIFLRKLNIFIKYNYILQLNKGIKFQKYQYKIINQLLQNYKQQDILYKKKDMPSIQYYNIINNKYYKYFPNFFIPKQNLIIEIKSKYTLKRNAFKNCLIVNAIFNNGYNFKIYIY